MNTILMTALVTALVTGIVTWTVCTLPDWYAAREFKKLGGPAVWIDPVPTTSLIVVGGQTFEVPTPVPVKSGNKPRS